MLLLPFTSVGGRQSQRKFFFLSITQFRYIQVIYKYLKRPRRQNKRCDLCFCVLGSICWLSAPHCPSRPASILPGAYSLRIVSPRLLAKWRPFCFCLFLAVAQELEGWRKQRAFLPHFFLFLCHLSFPSSPYTACTGLSAGRCIDNEKRHNPCPNPWRQLTF